MFFFGLKCVWFKEFVVDNLLNIFYILIGYDYEYINKIVFIYVIVFLINIVM